MQKSIKIIFFIFIFMFVQVNSCLASVDLPWSTTYDCADWTSGGTDPGCDGLLEGLTCDEGTCDCEQIGITGNYAGGAGGKGQIHPYCNGGSNSGGGTIIRFNVAQPELWVRTYIKYDAGASFENNAPQLKIFYIYRQRGQSQVVVPKWESTDTFLLGSSSDIVSFLDRGWATLNGGTIGDGNWHYLEFHIKADTNGLDGIAEVWLDDLPVQTTIGVDWGMAVYAGWIDMTIGSNALTVTNGPWNAYYDDISISNTGRIGQIESNDLIPPASPQGLSVL